MKKMILLFLVFGSISPAFSGQICVKDRAAREVLNVLDRYDIQPEMIAADLDSARERLSNGESYCGGTLNLLSGYSFCTGLAVINWDFYTQGNAKAQQELNRALAKFAREFPSSIESPDTFNCDLKLRFE